MAVAKLTIGELEAGYPLYCKALRRLLQEGLRTEEMYSFTYYERSTQQNVTVSNASEAVSNYIDAIRKEEEKRNTMLQKLQDNLLIALLHNQVIQVHLKKR